MMPKIEKQSPKPQAKPATGLLSRLVPLEQHVGKGIHMCLYGRTKTGKTRLMADFPKPIAILMADQEGEKSIEGIKGINIVQIVLSKTSAMRENVVEVDELVPLIIELSKSDYATICLDTATSLQEILLAKLCGLTEVALQKKRDLMPQNRKDEYIERSEQMKIIYNELLKMPDKHIIISAHEKNFNSEDDGGGSSDLDPSIGPDMSKAPAKFLSGNASYVCQTFIREKTVTEQSNAVPGKPVTIQRKVGGFEYCLRVGPDPIFNTGFRVVSGAELPDVIVSPTYNKIMAVIQGKKL